ncbi:MAG: SDR family NAD(P)-dependent oxidoreductase [Candidatus Lokiarchaeota archaeon]|nr:SDR family NAD(P)-dependent oxidoreductase [Candidatus Lokiarchaeota archaeon]
MSKFQKTVFITGASSGIGLSTAVYLLNLGHNVIGTSRSPDKLSVKLLEERYQREHMKYKFQNKQRTKVVAVKSVIPDDIKTNLHELLDTIKFYQLSLANRESINNAINNAWKENNGQNGGIDVLINNAGNGYYGGVEELPMDLVKDQFEINYFGQIRVIKAILPLMRPVGGKIINIASIAGFLGIPFQPQYSATKAALLRMTESLRNELKSYDISVCAVLPGNMNTSFNVESLKLHHLGDDMTSTDIEKMLESLPVNTDSPYYDENKNVWREVMLSLITAPSPLKVAKKIAKIIGKKHPKSQYVVACFLETLLMKYMRHIIPHSIGVNLIGKFFGL